MKIDGPALTSLGWTAACARTMRIFFTMQIRTVAKISWPRYQYRRPVLIWQTLKMESWPSPDDHATTRRARYNVEKSELAELTMINCSRHAKYRFPLSQCTPDENQQGTCTASTRSLVWKKDNREHISGSLVAGNDLVLSLSTVDIDSLRGVQYIRFLGRHTCLPSGLYPGRP